MNTPVKFVFDVPDTIRTRQAIGFVYQYEEKEDRICDFFCQPHFLKAFAAFVDTQKEVDRSWVQAFNYSTFQEDTSMCLPQFFYDYEPNNSFS